MNYKNSDIILTNWRAKILERSQRNEVQTMTPWTIYSIKLNQQLINKLSFHEGEFNAALLFQTSLAVASFHTWSELESQNIFFEI